MFVTIQGLSLFFLKNLFQDIKLECIVSQLTKISGNPLLTTKKICVSYNSGFIYNFLKNLFYDIKLECIVSHLTKISENPLLKTKKKKNLLVTVQSLFLIFKKIHFMILSWNV